MTVGRGARGPNLLSLIFSAVCLLGSLAASPASAQNFNTAIKPVPDSVTVRARPDYDAVGIRAGSFVVTPRIPIAETYDDNVYATDTNRTADYITELQPQIDIRSDWARHELDLSVVGDLGYHASATTEDYQNVTVRQTGRLDIGAADMLSDEVYYQHYQEPRTSVDDPRGVTPVKIDVKGGQLEFRRQTGEITTSVRGTISDSTFHNTHRADGSIINNHDRDRTVGTVSVEVGLDTGGLIRPFVQLNGMKVNFKLPVDDFGLNRDSKGYAINGGLVFPVTTMIQGRVFAGYIARLFKDPALPDIHDIGYGAQLIWSPSPTTSVEVNALKTVEETTLDKSSAAVTSTVTLGLDQEVLPNLLLHGQVQYERDRYVGIARTDEFWDGSIKLTYLMNHRLRASVGYDYSRRNAKHVPAFNNYRRNRATITLQLQF